MRTANYSFNKSCSALTTYNTYLLRIDRKVESSLSKKLKQTDKVGIALINSGLTINQGVFGKIPFGLNKYFWVNKRS